MRALLVLLFSVSTAQANDDYFNDRERGWFWYEEPPPVIEDTPKPEPEPVAVTAPVVSAPIPEPLSPREQLKQQGEEWEDALALAVLEPSRENYIRYLALTTQIQEQSHNFATGFKRTLWVTPEYDYSLKSPRNSNAIAVKNEVLYHEHQQQLTALAEQVGLIFFFRGDCPYCHKFAPILKKFAERYGFTVIPVAVDGGTLPEYPYPKEDYTLGRQLKVAQVPALFMIQPEDNRVAAVAYGYNDWSSLKAKILFAAEQLLGESTQLGALK